jgi:hypothetical protein
VDLHWHSLKRRTFFVQRTSLEARKVQEEEMEPPEEQRQRPQIPRQAVRLLWHCRYWDGPLTGICRYQGERYWFAAIDPFDEEKVEYVSPRRMGLYQLSPEELRVQEGSHQQFQRYVGMHTDYDEKEQRPIGAVRPKDEWNKFEAWLKQQPKQQFDYRQNEMIGWFEL